MKVMPIVLGCSIAFAVALIVCVIGGFVLYTEFVEPLISSNLERPVILDNPGITQGADTLDKAIFASDSQLGSITDIRAVSLLLDHGTVIAAVSSEGAVFFDRSGKSVHSTRFSGSNADHVDLIDVGSTNGYAFLNRRSWDFDASLIDSDGVEIWKYGGLWGVDDMCAGDLDGDGELEFVVGFNGPGGIHLLNAQGKRLWREKGGNVWHVEIVDTTGNGSMHIVHSDASGAMTIRDVTGSIVKRSKPRPYFSDFSLCPWPTSTSRSYALLSEDEIIWLLDYDGSAVAQYPAPGCGSLGHARGVPAKLEAVTADYLAVIVDFGNWNSAIFYVYDSSGNLIFNEVIPESCPAITTLRDDSTGTDTILVGGTGKIWSYRMAGNGTPLEGHPTGASAVQ